MYVRKHYKTIPTELGRLALQVRMSLRETQAVFAERFMVNWITVSRWETGKTRGCSRVNHRILLNLRERLKAEGRLLPESVFDTFYNEELERKNELANVN